MISRIPTTKQSLSQSFSLFGLITISVTIRIVTNNNNNKKTMENQKPKTNIPTDTPTFNNTHYLEANTSCFHQPKAISMLCSLQYSNKQQTVEIYISLYNCISVVYQHLGYILYNKQRVLRSSCVYLELVACQLRTYFELTTPNDIYEQTLSLKMPIYKEARR